jgi:hypothetical protein
MESIFPGFAPGRTWRPQVPLAHGVIPLAAPNFPPNTPSTPPGKFLPIAPKSESPPYRNGIPPPFYAPDHDVVRGTSRIDSRSPWHPSPLSLPSLLRQLRNLTPVPLPPIEAFREGVVVAVERADLYAYIQNTSSHYNLTDLIGLIAKLQNREGIVEASKILPSKR